MSERLKLVKRLILKSKLTRIEMARKTIGQLHYNARLQIYLMIEKKLRIYEWEIWKFQYKELSTSWFQKFGTGI